jgi:hypothetical protein
MLEPPSAAAPMLTTDVTPWWWHNFGLLHNWLSFSVQIVLLVYAVKTFLRVQKIFRFMIRYHNANIQMV